MRILALKKLIKKAFVAVDKYPCRWLIGILLSEFTDIDSAYDPTDEFKIEYTNASNTEWTSSTYYGDASGGKHTSLAKLGRVGCAVVQVNPDATSILEQVSTSLAVYTLLGEVNFSRSNFQQMN